MDCRKGCGACCIAPSISSSIPGMPDGKSAGVRCVQLTDNNCCRLFGSAERPKVCTDFSASKDICGSSFKEAMILIENMEKTTS